MRKKSIVSIIGIFLIICSLSLILTACSGEASYRVIKIFSYSGTCNVIRDSKELAVQKDMKIKNEDTLDVKANSNAILKLDSDKFVCVKENSKVKFVATGKEKNTKTRLHVLDGGVIVEVKEKLKDGEAFEIASSNSVMAIRGTQISFDVETTEDTITSTFSILTGNTEIFLYKDETMNSTSLVKDYMMSYTTSLIKTTDEIYKIYDSTDHQEISDEDLETIYNVRKVRISNKKINEMVEIVNDFEKVDEEIVNGVINLDTPLSVTYGVDPKSLISVLDENKYIDFSELEFTYSKSIDGTYSEFDSNNPLSAGNWYVIVSAGNAYKSDPYQFRVSEKMVSFDIPSTVPFKTDPKTLITSNEDISNYEFGYSTTVDGTYGKFDSNNPIQLGKYYVKVITPNYTSEAIMFNVTQASMSISLRNSSVSYKANPNTIITIANQSSYTQIKYGYSQNENGPFNKTFSSTSPLEVGTWYVKVTANGGTSESNILSFEVVSANLDMSLSETDIYYEDNILNYLTINGTYENVKYYYSDAEDGEYTEFNDSTLINVGTYYLKLDSNGQYISSPVEFVIRQKQINYTISSEVGYRVDPSTAVTITSGTYTNVTYEYSTSSTGPFAEFDSTNPLSIGMWYIKVSIDSNYLTQVKSFNVVQTEITYSFTSTSVEYGTNPNTIIRVTGSYDGTIKYTYAARTSDTFVEFDSSNPFTYGTWYVKLVINDNYYSQTKSFSITKQLIDYTISSEITYGNNIIDEITINGTYGTINYYYSTSSSFDNSHALTGETILEPGTYYVQLISGTNYESVVKSFEIVPITVNYTVGSSVEYGTDPANIISLDGEYPEYNYKYSQTQNGTYREFGPNELLEPGTWYVKVDAGVGYTSVPKSFTVTKATLDFGCNSNILYGESLYDNIEVGQNVDIYYSTSLNGTYTKYNVNNPLAVGTYYIYLENDYYISGKKEIEIFDILDIMLPISVEPVFICGSTCLKLTIGDNEFFNSSYAQIKESGKYKYYILASFVYGRDGEHQDFILDYENRSVIYTGSSSDTIQLEFHLPTDVFNVLNDSEIHIDSYDALVQISNVAIDPLGNVYARIDEAYTDVYWATIKAYYKFDNGTETEVVLSTEGGLGDHYDRYTGELVFNVGSLKSKKTLTVRYTYEYDDVYDITFDADTYVFTLSNLNATSDYTFSPSNDNRFVTFNSDGTINAYYDLGFVNETDYNLGCEVVYGSYEIESETDVVFSGTSIQFTTSRFLACENLPVDNYAIYDYRIVNYVDGLMYILYRYSEEEDFEPYDTYLIYYDSYVVSATFDYDSYEGFDVQGKNANILDGTDIKVYVSEYNDDLDAWELVLKATFDEFKSNGWSDEVLIPVEEGEESITINATYTQVTVLNKTFASSLLGSTYTSDLKLSTDTLFNQVKEAMESTYNITIKGYKSIERNSRYYFSNYGD